MEYSNILNAINNMKPSQNPSMDDLNRRNENYKLVDQLNQEGVSLKDLLTQVDELKKKVESLEKPSQTIDEDLFAVMESAVRDDPIVIEAKKRVSDEKTRVIAELCAKDPKFMAARDEYRRAVNKAYVSRRENGQTEQARREEGRETPCEEICEDSAGCEDPETGHTQES